MNALNGCWSVLWKASHWLAEDATQQLTQRDTTPQGVASVRRRRWCQAEGGLFHGDSAQLATNWPLLNLALLLMHETMNQQRIWTCERARKKPNYRTADVKHLPHPRDLKKPLSFSSTRHGSIIMMECMLTLMQPVIIRNELHSSEIWPRDPPATLRCFLAQQPPFFLLSSSASCSSKALSLSGL